MSRTRRFLGGLTIGYINQGLVMVVGLWLTAFLLRTLGSHDYGLWLVSSQILGYLMLADFGIVALLPRETAYATGRAGGVASSQDLREMIGHTLRLVLWELPLVAAAAVLVWIYLPKDWEPLRGPLALVLFTFVATFPLRMLNGVLQGLQDLAYLGTVQIIAWSIGTATAALMAFRGYGLYALTTGWVVTQGLSAILWWWRLRSRFRDAMPTSLPPLDWQRMKSYLSKSVWVSVAQVAQVFLNGSDVLVIGKLLGPAAAVPYFCTAKLVSVLANQPQMVMQAAAPALSELRTAGSRERLLSVTTALTRAMLITSGAVGAVVLAVNAGFVQWWVGGDRYGGVRLTVALIAVMIIRHWNTTAVYSIFAFGRERRTSITGLADGLTTLGAAFVLVPRIGILGAPLASLLGVSLVSLPWNLAALAKETGISFLRQVAAVGPWAWRFLLASGIAVLAIHPLAASGGPQWLALAAAGISAVYAALMLPFALRDPLGHYVRPRVAALHPVHVTRRIAALAAGRIGRESWLIRSLRPIYETSLDLATAGRGVPWVINGVTYRIDPHERHRMGAEYDRPVAEWLAARVKPGAVSLDVGANVGVYVLQFAHWSRPGGRVIAFEPNPAAREILEQHVRVNGIKNRVEIIPAAVGSRAGASEFFTAGADGMSRLGTPNPALAAEAENIIVPVVTLDDFCRALGLAPDWLFLDIEGYEIAALAGARTLFAERGARLGVVVEMHPDAWEAAGSSRAELESLLRSLSRRAVPLSGQSDPLGAHGHVWLEPV